MSIFPEWAFSLTSVKHIFTLWCVTVIACNRVRVWQVVLCNSAPEYELCSIGKSFSVVMKRSNCVSVQDRYMNRCQGVCRLTCSFIQCGGCTNPFEEIQATLFRVYHDLAMCLVGIHQHPNLTTLALLRQAIGVTQAGRFWMEFGVVVIWNHGHFQQRWFFVLRPPPSHRVFWVVYEEMCQPVNSYCGMSTQCFSDGCNSTSCFHGARVSSLSLSSYFHWRTPRISNLEVFPSSSCNLSLLTQLGKETNSHIPYLTHCRRIV